MVSRAKLIAELLEQGIRCTPDDIIRIVKLPYGKIVFLETGNAKAGLQHILKQHADDFANQGIPAAQIPGAIMAAITTGQIVGYQGEGETPRPIYQTTFLDKIYYISITVSINGFIVGANPISQPPFKQANP